MNKPGSVLNPMQQKLVHKPITILVIEDDPGHMRLIEKNLRRAGISNEIIHLADGQEAMDFLFPKDPETEFLEPALILLDLNLPVYSGTQILERLKNDEDKRHIPIIVLTTTDDIREIKRCYELGCNIYITKPVEYQEFSEAIRKLGFLMTIITVPSNKND